MSAARVAISAAAYGDSGFTTAPEDTTGATLIVVPVSSYETGATVSDSYHNTYTPLTQYGGEGYHSQIWYCLSPTGGPGHTITVAGGFTYSAGCLIAYSGDGIALDSFIGAASASTATLAPGSITPSATGDLFVTVAATYGGGTFTDASGFTLERTFSPAFNSAACADLIATDASAQNPVWSSTQASGISAAMAAFSVTASSPPTSGDGSASGVGSVIGVGQSTAVSTSTISGSSSVSGQGRSTVSSTGTIAGSADLEANSGTTQSGAGSAAGSSTVSGVNDSRAIGTGSASGSSTVTGPASALAVAVGTISGSSGVSAPGGATAEATGSIQGSSAVRAFSPPLQGTNENPLPNIPIGFPIGPA